MMSFRKISVTVCASLLLLGFTVGGSASAAVDPISNVSTLSEFKVNTNTDVDMNDEDIKNAYGYAQEYVKYSRMSWQSKYDTAYWAQVNIETQDKYSSGQYDLVKKEESAAAANRVYNDSLNVMGAWARAGARGELLQVPIEVSVLLDQSLSMRGITDDIHYNNLTTNQVLYDEAQAEANKKVADAALADAEAQRVVLEKLISDAANAKAKSKKALEESQASLNNARKAWNQTWISLNNKDSSLGQRLLNLAIKDAWNVYIDDLEKVLNGQPLPLAEGVAVTTRLAPGFSTPKTIDITDSTGLAEYNGTTIPSREALDRSYKAVISLGTPYSATDEGGISCETFTTQLTGSADMNEAYQSSGRQNVSIMDSHTGDIVFIADPHSGIHQAGIYLFDGFMIDASASSKSVSVETVGVDALASVRPLTTIIKNSSAPVREENSLDWKCGGIEGLDASEFGIEQWSSPLTEEYTITSHYTDADNTTGGITYTSVNQQAVKSIFRGTVTDIIDDPSSGMTIIVDHAGGTVSQYSFLSSTTVTVGQELSSGAIIGTTGEIEGKALFLKVEFGGVSIDPETLLYSPKQGEYQNGQIPASALCPISVSNGMLRCDATRSFEIMAAAFYENFGYPIPVSDTYRSLSGQIRCTAEKGDMCATPGTSNHGWGLAIDFAGGINVFGTPQHVWMQNNASKYGWYHPSWAQANGSKPEPWHWEFYATK